MAGYSGTPLARKLGLRSGQRVWSRAMPPSVREEIDSSCPGLVWLDTPATPLEAAHVFVAGREELRQALASLRPLLDASGFLWISWPKKSARLASEVSEDDIRRAALPLGYVDVKVCAVDETWSGLKLVIRKALRGPAGAKPRP